MKWSYKMKALKILLDERKQQLDIFEQNKELGNPNENNYIVLLNEAIKELEAIKKNIDTSIEEIEYALAKPEYACNYLNNALRYLKERI